MPTGLQRAGFHIRNTKETITGKKRKKICNTIKKFALILFASFAFLITAEMIYFLTILMGSEKIEKADLIVVFEGRDGRSKAAYELADLGCAPGILISPAGHNMLDVYDQIYKPRKQFGRVMETKATTTFENALFSSEIIKEKGFDSVILVTSWDHMPRSYLLMRIMMAGSNVRIYPHSVKTGNTANKAWYRTGLAWKMVCNEMVETWGSQIELVNYRINGRIPKTRPGKKNFISKLKGWLLFEIDLEKKMPSNYVPE